MSNLKLDWMADAFRDEGCTVLEHTGWKTRSNSTSNTFNPVGVINHHTAGSAVIPNYPNRPFYRNEALDDKCNFTVRPDGVVVVLNAGYAYDSGLGAPEILEAVRRDRPLPALHGLRSTINGNPYFIDNEVQHLGDGRPIEPVQREALILTNIAICKHYGWDPMTRVIGHREWAPDRKVDPRWDGLKNPMPQIRLDTKAGMETDMVTDKDKSDIAELSAAKVWQALWHEAGIGAGDTPDKVTAMQALVRGFKLAKDTNSKVTLTKTQVALIVAGAGAAGAAGATAPEIVAEMGRLLSGG